MNVDIFDGINENLAKLDKTTKDAIVQLIFSFRESVESVWVAFESFEVFSKLVGVVPEKIKQDYQSDKSHRFYVDLESLNTNNVLLHASYKEKGVQLIGYYVNNGEIYETEIYKDIVDIRPKSMTVKRYDSEMNLIDDQETENAVESSEWSGNKEIINIALENGLTVRCLKKTIKNHSSLIVRRDSEGSVE
jgi:hypothetical protein